MIISDFPYIQITYITYQPTYIPATLLTYLLYLLYLLSYLFTYFLTYLLSVHVLTERHAPWPSPEQQTYNVQTHLVNCSSDWRPPPARAHLNKRMLDKAPDPQTGDLPPAQAHVTSAFLIKRLFLRLEIASSTERRWGTPEKKGVEIFQLNVYF